jgi:hypothetical protein
MEIHLLVLLLITISSALCIVAGVFTLLWRGHQAAVLRACGHTSLTATADRLIKWNESTTATTGQKTLEAVRRAFTSKLSSITGANDRLPLSFTPVVDPVDGTAFQQGETIVRCRCGTNYHQHSWQWIGENNHAKCVNCKRPGLVSTYTRNNSFRGP